jgi:hypothetical protein
MKPRTYHVYSYTFSANETVRVELPGDDIFIRDSSGEVLIKLDSPSSPEIPIRNSEKLRTDGFNLFLVKSVTAQTVKFIVGSRNLGVDGLNFVADVSIESGSDLQTTADVSMAGTDTTLIKAANATRKQIIITNLSGNASILRIGDSNAGATRGTPLEAGQTLILDTEDAVYAYNPGSAQSVAVTEIIK